MQNNGLGDDLRDAVGVPGQVIGGVGRFGSCRCSALWFVRDSGCLHKKSVTDESKGVVMVLAEETDPIIISAVFLAV